MMSDGSIPATLDISNLNFVGSDRPFQAVFRVWRLRDRSHDLRLEPAWPGMHFMADLVDFETVSARFL